MSLQNLVLWYNEHDTSSFSSSSSSSSSHSDQNLKPKITKKTKEKEFDTFSSSSSSSEDENLRKKPQKKKKSNETQPLKEKKHEQKHDQNQKTKNTQKTKKKKRIGISGLKYSGSKTSTKNVRNQIRVTKQKNKKTKQLSSKFEKKETQESTKKPLKKITQTSKINSGSRWELLQQKKKQEEEEKLRRMKSQRVSNIEPVGSRIERRNFERESSNEGKSQVNEKKNNQKNSQKRHSSGWGRTKKTNKNSKESKATTRTTTRTKNESTQNRLSQKQLEDQKKIFAKSKKRNKKGEWDNEDEDEDDDEWLDDKQNFDQFSRNKDYNPISHQQKKIPTKKAYPKRNTSNTQPENKLNKSQQQQIQLLKKKQKNTSSWSDEEDDEDDEYNYQQTTQNEIKQSKQRKQSEDMNDFVEPEGDPIYYLMTKDQIRLSKKINSVLPLKKGETVQFLCLTEKDIFFKGRDENKNIGLVHQNYCRKLKEGERLSKDKKENKENSNNLETGTEAHTSTDVETKEKIIYIVKKKYVSDEGSTHVLTLKKGDQIEYLGETATEGWMNGRNQNGEIGYFFISYVKLQGEEDSSETPTESNSSSESGSVSKSNSESGSGPGSSSSSETKSESEGVSQSSSLVSSPMKNDEKKEEKEKKIIYIITSDYTPPSTLKTVLKVKKGEEIEFIGESKKQGWIRGKNKEGKIGFVNQKILNKKLNLTISPNKKPKIKPKSKKRTKPRINPETKPRTNPKTNPRTKKPQKSIFIVTKMFLNNQGIANALVLMKGDRIEFLNMHGNEGWMNGKDKSGNIGYFHKKYVKFDSGIDPFKKKNPKKIAPIISPQEKKIHKNEINGIELDPKKKYVRAIKNQKNPEKRKNVLVFKKESIVELIDKTNERWWKGNYNHKIGYFLSVNVEELKSKQEKEISKEKTKEKEKKIKKEKEKRKAKRTIKQKTKTETTTKEKEKEAKAKVYVKAIKKFKDNPGFGAPLHFEKGDVIELIDELPTGWWKGKLNNETGLFPSKCVTKMDTDNNSNNQSVEVKNQKETKLRKKKIDLSSLTSGNSGIETEKKSTKSTSTTSHVKGNDDDRKNVDKKPPKPNSSTKPNFKPHTNLVKTNTTNETPKTQGVWFYAIKNFENVQRLKNINSYSKGDQIKLIEPSKGEWFKGKNKKGEVGYYSINNFRVVGDDQNSKKNYSLISHGNNSIIVASDLNIDDFKSQPKKKKKKSFFTKRKKKENRKQKEEQLKIKEKEKAKGKEKEREREREREKGKEEKKKVYVAKTKFNNPNNVKKAVNFKKGEKVEFIQSLSNKKGWFVGKDSKNKTGFFKLEYFEEESQLSTNVVGSKPKHEPKTQSTHKEKPSTTIKGKKSNKDIYYISKCSFSNPKNIKKLLAYKKGEKIKLIKFTTGDWFSGENKKGKKGYLLKKNFIEEKVNVQEKEKEKEKKQPKPKKKPRTKPRTKPETKPRIKPRTNPKTKPRTKTTTETTTKQKEKSSKTKVYVKAIKKFKDNPGFGTPLHFEKGDIIELIDELPTGWWKGKLNNKSGLFPSKCVTKKVSKNEIKKAISKEKSSSKSTKSISTRKTTTQLIAIKTVKDTKGLKNALTFRKGDTFELIKKVGERWYLVLKNGKKGYVPVSYMKVKKK
ncbi:las seventeen-binding protein [Anaeramoeba flamelloides]|uniref:Las seventeen-binding protein n=1 Tax=Anaeramoeba flamelloides TaxID=1746091 RepID=A0AAV7Y5I8_9EUKA|nr:las seventeen-binding protein [Anaeramoeba flamelloides]